jgi:hypothetical protein
VRRQQFCEQMLGKCVQQPEFLLCVPILFIDKAGFTRDGVNVPILT